MPTTTIILIRHAEHDGLGRLLTGRRVGSGLTAWGFEQATRLAGAFARRQIAQVISSSRLRARQTAAPIAAACALPLQIDADFDEIDYGAWTSRSLAELANNPHWRRWNEQRATSRPPRGESMGELQARVLRGLASVASANSGRRIVIVSHAEPIRTALLHFRGLSLDEFGRVPVEPASVTPLYFEAEPQNLVTDSAAAEVTA